MEHYYLKPISRENKVIEYKYSLESKYKRSLHTLEVINTLDGEYRLAYIIQVMTVGNAKLLIGNIIAVDNWINESLLKQVERILKELERDQEFMEILRKVEKNTCTLI